MQNGACYRLQNILSNSIQGSALFLWWILLFILCFTSMAHAQFAVHPPTKLNNF